MAASPSHLLTLADWSAQQLQAVLELADAMASQPQRYEALLKGRQIATLYEKPSLRTRVSFDAGIQRLGGHAIYLDQQNGALGQRETVADFGRNLACWVDAIVARVNDHQTLVTLAEHAGVPVINALCNLYHPCQALADFLTLKQQGLAPASIRLAWVGDGNNVCHSLMLLAARLGAQITVITPPGYGPDGHVLQLAQQLAAASGACIQLSHALEDARDHDAIYTDTWISMGEQKDEAAVRRHFAPYQLTTSVLEQLGISRFMHCQPVHRGEEASSELVDGPLSLLMQQARNRLFAQNAVLATLLAQGDK